MITSIILVTYNKLAYTQACIESIRRHTMSGSYEIIVVDNGSTDDTPVWLEEQQDIICRLNGRNEGFPKACNQGIAVASGEQMMLLNNDTIVTPRWLEGLLQGLHSDPKVGAVGPVTNYASYMTQIPTDYETLEKMEQFAARHNVHDPTKWEERLKLIGYCLLMKREACEAAGSLDERFGIGNYEDDDYSLRLLLAGYKLLLCGDTFIHHFGSVSFGADREKYQTIVSDNHVHFVQKWGFEPGPAMNVRLDLLTVVEQELPDYKHGESIAVLDIGCGCGGTLLRMKRNHPGSALYGLERDPLISRIAEAAGITIVGSEAPQSWGIREGSLDAIIIGNAHEFASKPEELKALAGLLKPQGWLVGSYANRHCFRLVKQFMSSARNLDTSMLYTTEQARGMLSKAGLNTLKLAYAADALSAEDERFIQGLAEWMEQASEEPFTAVYFISLGQKPVAGAQAAGDLRDHHGRLDNVINEVLTETGSDHAALKENDIGEVGGSEIEEGEERKIGEAGGSEIEEGEERKIGEVGASEIEKGEERDIGEVGEKNIEEVGARAGKGAKERTTGIRPVTEQNDVSFTGERLVVNREVKERYRDVYEEHMIRYELAASLVSGLHVLDAACGTGYGAAMLRAAGASTVIGVDVDAASVERATVDYGADGISFLAGDVLALPFDAGSFDAVVSFETIEHVQSGSEWIRESARVLKEGGRFIVSTPNRALTNAANYYEEQPFNPHHRFEYRTSELVGELLQVYDLEALYGQNVYDDSQFAAMRWLRGANNLPVDRMEKLRVQSRGHSLIPLAELKSGEPMYVVAVCRKKRARG